MSDGIFIRLLGAVTSERHRGPEAVPIELGPARQQATLAILASAGAHPVPMDRLVAGIWGDEAPRNAEQSVYTYIAGLRRVFEPGRGRREPSRLLAGTSAGYVLHLLPGQVDALRFAERLNEAHRAQRDGDDPEAVRLLGEALRMWRGTALSGLPGPFAEKERSRLEELRLAALDQRAESLLRLGRHQEITEELRDLTRHHPLRERTRELLMTALFRSGRQAEALEVYEEGRTVLAEELGLSPGEGLRRCHAMVLRADKASAARPVVPHQLPRPLAEFVGRSQELVRLRERLTPWDGAPPRPLLIITGPAGVGKSTLAAQVAHAAKDRFPDGQLYVNCRGATPDMSTLTPLDVLGRFLRGLGVPPDAVPSDLDEAAALWRSRLHDRRVLAFLDDAADLAQVRPLLATPFGSTLLVTSRETMTWSEDAFHLELDRMSHAESATMLAKLAGAGRVAADARETARLVRLCDGLPLALRIAGARLASRPDWSIAALATRLSDERRRLHELAAGDLAVRSSLTAGYTALERGSRPLDRLAARTIGLLGLLHVPDVTAEVACALLGTTAEEAEAAMERLVDAHLIDRARHGHYQLHDLVRLFAGELRPEGAKEALVRVLSYYTASARHASVLVDPHRVQPGKPVEGAAVHAVTDPVQAHAWLMDEEPNLTAAARQALTSADDTIAELGVRLSFALTWHQQRVNSMAAMEELHRLALRVSERLGDEQSTMLSHGYISNALRLMMRTDEAIEHLMAELELARKLGDAFDEQRTLGNLANANLSGERYEDVIPWAERQLVLAKKIGATIGVRYALLMRGGALKGAGRLEQAREDLYQLLAEAQLAGDTTHEAHGRIHLGELHLDLGDPGKALGHFLRAQELTAPFSVRTMRLRMLIGLSRTHRLLGDLDAALEHVSEAVASGAGLGYPRWERRLKEEQAAVHEALGASVVRFV